MSIFNLHKNIMLRFALQILFVIVIVAAYYYYTNYVQSDFTPKREHVLDCNLVEVPPSSHDDDLEPRMVHKRDVYEQLSKFVTTADVDPLITGKLYEHKDHLRNVYSERVGDHNACVPRDADHKWGLTEFSSSGGVGDVGYDVGPYGLNEYGNSSAGTDDGIPPEWRLPTTPVRWYSPHKRDYYGENGPTPYTEGLYKLNEADHDPLVGDD